jgi:aromatic amino acid aminotransferase I / 2-aminoadipate transaminase
MRRMEFEVPVIDSEDPVFAWRSGTGSSMKISASTDPRSSVVPLQRGLGYTTGAGLPETQRVFGEITELFHAPPNHEVTPTLGNCDGVSKCFRLLGDRGDNFLADEFSFSALTNAAVAHGVNWIPVKIDKGGMIPDEMERILREWKEEERGRRPHVLYTTPSGQNPTGSTLSLERRQQVYDIAQRYDIVIIEDGRCACYLDEVLLLIGWFRSLLLPSI